MYSVGEYLDEYLFSKKAANINAQCISTGLYVPYLVVDKEYIHLLLADCVWICMDVSVGSYFCVYECVSALMYSCS